MLEVFSFGNIDTMLAVTTSQSNLFSLLVEFNLLEYWRTPLPTVHFVDHVLLPVVTFSYRNGRFTSS